MSERRPIHAREELNALRAILFTPPVGTRLLMNEDRRLDLAAHLNRLEEWCERAHDAIRAERGRAVDAETRLIRSRPE